MRLMQAAALATLTLFLMGGAPPAQPVWIAAPTGEAMVAAYPAAARLAHAGGRVVLSCAVTAQGGLDNCRVVSQSPEDQGFGEAALVLAPSFRMREALSDGSAATGLRFSIPIRFAPPEPGDAVLRREVVFNVTTKGYAELGPVGPYFPDRAVRNSVEGVAVIQCRAAADGRLTQCISVSAMPKDWGFDYAALRMALKGWITAAPRLENGQPVDGETVRIEVPFQVRR
jgi:TonB family protein